MSEHPNVSLPCSSVPFSQTVRFYFYVRAVIRLCATPVAAIYAFYYFIKEAVEFNYYGDLPVLLSLVTLLSAPNLILLARVLRGRNGLTGLLRAHVACKRWRDSWASISEASVVVRQRCRQSAAVFELPKMRQRPPRGRHQQRHYQQPDDVLADIQSWPNFVTFGHVQNQPIQAIDAGSLEAANDLVRRIASTAVGRILSKDLECVVFKGELRNELRLVFVTDVRTGDTHHGYIWTTLSLRVDGTVVNGFVESVRTFYFDKGRLESGQTYHGDQLRAKKLWPLLQDAVIVASPLCFWLAIRYWWNGVRELFDGRVSNWFFQRYRPDAGESVDLSLIAEVGNGLEVDKGFLSTVESVRSNLVIEVQMVVASFYGASDWAA